MANKTAKRKPAKKLGDIYKSPASKLPSRKKTSMNKKKSKKR